MELDYYREVVSRIRESDTDLLINLTTGPGGRFLPSGATGVPNQASCSLGYRMIPFLIVLGKKSQLMVGTPCINVPLFVHVQ